MDVTNTRPVKLNDEAKKALAGQCLAKLVEKKQPDYLLLEREGKVSAFFKEHLQGWIKNIQINLTQETLGDLLERLKSRVFVEWKNVSSKDKEDEAMFLDFWGKRVEEIKGILTENRNKKVQDSTLPLYVREKYLDCSDDSVPSKNKLRNLKKAWNKEQARNKEIEKICEKSPLSEKDYRRLLELFCSKKDYFANFSNKEEVIAGIEDRIKSIKTEISRLKEKFEKVIPTVEKIREWNELIVRYKNRTINQEEIERFLEEILKISKVLGKLNETDRTKDQETLYRRTLNVINAIENAKKIYSEALACWNKGLKKGLRFPQTKSLNYSITIDQKYNFNIVLNPLMTCCYLMINSSRIKAIKFMKGIEDKRSHDIADKLISDQVNEIMKRIKEFSKKERKILKGNIKELTSFVTEEFKQALKKFKKDNNSLKGESNKKKIVDFINREELSASVQNKIYNEYEAFADSYPSDFLYLNCTLAWDAILKKIKAYKKFFREAPALVATIKDEIFSSTEWKEERNQEHAKKLLRAGIESIGKEEYFTNMPFSDWILDEVDFGEI
ncbi:MAG: hypothetical protein S4CHLAM20_15290 [Chlamydiia bacterium]|nr:hypothetical protein [Chlamydiia bacterium]